MLALKLFPKPPNSKSSHPKIYAPQLRRGIIITNRTKILYIVKEGETMFFY